MAVYKIFPTKDTSLYSLFPQMNTGLDPILESSTVVLQYNDSIPFTSRFLTQFSSDEITDIINNKVSNSTWEANLKYYVSIITGLNTTSSIVVNPVAKEWGNGTGRYLDDPISMNGASWIWADYSGSNKWTDNGNDFPAYATGSWNLNYSDRGGGIWYTGSSNTYHPDVTASYEFALYQDNDPIINVTNIVHNWYSGSLPNYGFIVRQPPINEFSTNINDQTELKFFSIDTNTIYPPCLEIKWDDYTWDTGSSDLTVLTNPSIYLSVAENPNTFYSESINRFRINCRPKYPIRVWSTSSLYTQNYYLPTASYYAIKDLDTNNYVVEFDTTYTKLSADATSSYFDVYMNGLEPERNYEILIQTTINGTTMVMDDGYYFKVSL